MPVPEIVQLERWLAANFPEMLSSLRPAGPALITLVPKRPGCTLAHALYRWHNGQPTMIRNVLAPALFHRYRLLTIADARAHRKTLDKMAEVGEWDDERYRWDTWWVPGWVPILGDFSDNLVCIDLVGTFTGNAGQLIEFIHDDEARTILAPSFDAWFRAWLASLEAGLWQREGDKLAPVSDAKLAAFFRTQLPGYPIKRRAGKTRIVAAAKKPGRGTARR